MDRRKFLRNSSLALGTWLVIPTTFMALKKKGELMSVRGPVSPNELGVTLIHEHIMADFIGAAETGTHRYQVDAVVSKALPYLLELKEAGCKTFIDCTPVYLGRDVRVLKKLSEASGLHIFTTTGYYGAMKEKFLPPHAYTETAEQLAARWVKEFHEGIEGSGVRPGLIKVSVDEGPLPEMHQKLLNAASITHLQTGLSISAHTGNGVAALEQLQILSKAGVDASAFRWVHAQQEKDKGIYERAAKMGAWIEFDGIDENEPGSIARHIDCLLFMKSKGLLARTLISQDAGWYWVGEPDGGKFRGYTALFTKFIPALKEKGFNDDEIHQLLVDNPRESLLIKVRKKT